MKMKLSIAISTTSFFLLLFSSCTFITDHQVDSKSNYYYYSWHKKNIYFRTVSIYHQWIPIPTEVSKRNIQADAETFEVLNEVIAKDKDFVYCRGSKIKDIGKIDAPTFHLVSRDLFKDKDHVYLYILGTNKLDIIEDADPKTFHYLESNRGLFSLSKDKKGYFFDNKRIDVDISTFNVGLNSEIGFDKNFVYVFTHTPMISIAIDGKLIKVNETLQYDDSKIFYTTWQGKVVLDTIQIKNKKLFAIYTSDKNTIFKANNKLYWNNYIIDNLDLTTFKYLGGDYAKDKNGVYIIRNRQKNNVLKLSQVDTKTFTYIRDNIAYDKYNVYYGGQVIENADPETIQKIEGGLQDKNHNWKWNRDEKFWDIVSK